MLNNQKPTTPVLIQDLGMQYPKETSKSKKRYALYKCKCGEEFKAHTGSVKDGLTTSCGCYQKQQVRIASKTHGLSSHKIYDVWVAMNARCNNKNHPSYKDYGDRGIKVCERWQNVANFIEDMYPTFEEGLTLDRRDNDGDYEPSNCRWTTNEVQTSNTRIIKSTNTSGYRGVTFHKRAKRWVASISVAYKQKYLGLFDTPMEAATVYDNYILENNLPHTRNFNTMT